ncbi:MAG TPA: fumarylacetoacetate hydrolase family protein [Dehalococcoidia bacterium]|jgi:2-keto-4-pentenoate hydratase/2-oxohepta-3-ene-1,7-dioic acid hydratase in catechol pathway
MRLVLFEGPGAGRGIRPGVLTDAGVVDVSRVTDGFDARTPQELMTQIIDDFEELRSLFEEVVDSTRPVPLDIVRLRPPLPRPGKILCCIGNYWEHEQRDPRPLNVFLKNPDAVIGPGDTIVLPAYNDKETYGDSPGPYVFQHEAELALVFKGPSKSVPRDEWHSAVFGVTGMIDVSARAEARFTWRQGSWMGKSFDTFAPIGPAITTLDEVVDPNNIHVRFWNNGDLRHDYNTDDMEHRVPQLVEFASGIMTLNSGDVLACGTNHEGLGPLQDGEVCEFEVEKVGRMTLHVRDPLKRVWERGVYMGPNSTNPEARRQRGQG